LAANQESRRGLKIKKLIIFVLPQIKIIMQQIYHLNAMTNINIRQQIQNSTLSNEDNSSRFGVSKQTVSKWKNREFTQDLSSRPHNIEYGLSELEQALVISLRSSSWLPLDEIFEFLLEFNPNISRSSVYRCLRRSELNKVPKSVREKAKKFKEYDPGYLHIDVTYLPKFDGTKSYLFVAIDRATRLMYYKVYGTKTAKSTNDFMDECLSFFPFDITHILTDNGLEFTNRLLKSKKGESCTKPSLMDLKCEKEGIEHRLTKPFTPKTNGMVERVNGTIKNNTILKYKYENAKEMESELLKFLYLYNVFRRHGSLRRELNVKTPLDAVFKWFELKPEIFKMSPTEFKNKLITLNEN
jgi:transposase-like protein